MAIDYPALWSQIVEYDGIVTARTGPKYGIPSVVFYDLFVESKRDGTVLRLTGVQPTMRPVVPVPGLGELEIVAADPGDAAKVRFVGPVTLENRRIIIQEAIYAGSCAGG